MLAAYRAGALYDRTRRSRESTVLIKSLEVDGGFLDGLTVEFGQGLNVVVGPRGVGKTSVIELLRFALGAPSYSERTSAAAADHARSVLNGGQVTVTIEADDGRLLTAIRSSNEAAPRFTPGAHRSPIVLSQNEIEQIGLEPQSRLRLVDGFRTLESGSNEAEQAALAMVSSLTTEIRSVAQQFRAAAERLASTEDLASSLAEARKAEAQLVASAAAAEPERKRLDQLGADTATLEVGRDALERAATSASEWADGVRRTHRGAPRFEWPSNAGKHPEALVALEDTLASAQRQLGAVAADVEGAARKAGASAEAALSQLVVLNDEARTLRRRLEELQKGAGSASQRVANLETAVAQRQALIEEVSALRARVVELQGSRASYLRDLETARETRFVERSKVAKRINSGLGPVIHVAVIQSAGIEPYSKALQKVLQGSGLHHNTLAPQLAERLSPREFVELVELGQADQLATLVGLAPDRAVRVVASAENAKLDQVLTTRIEDTVELTLLDESVPKATQLLSTGQRCTTVLPILLLHDERVLVLDQPEDHLDNAYVVDTLVKSFHQRSLTAQTIVATHNANIPVLAGASRVIVMGSDGQHGFVRLAAPLDSPSAVEAISQIMEGGAEAFRLRAAFYAQHLGK